MTKIAPPTAITSQVLFLYYEDMEQITRFYGEIMGFKLVEDQGWAKIFRVTDGAFIGAVDGSRGHHPVRTENSVAVALAVSDVQAWYKHLVAHNVTIKTEPKFHEEIQVEGFFAKDPGGYTIEIQRFAKPELADIFHELG